MEQYSFIKHPIDAIHDYIPELLPGINKIITIHRNESKTIMAFYSEKMDSAENYKTKKLDIQEIQPALINLMGQKSPYDWLNKQNLPFIFEKKSAIKVLDIFTEYENVILLIRIPEENMDSNSLIFVFLNQNPSNFGVTNSINPLTTDNKSIIAYLMRGAIYSFVKQQRGNKLIHLKLAEKTNMLISRTEGLTNELKITRENYGISLVKLCQQILFKIGENKSVKYSLSSTAIAAIKNYKGELNHLESILLDAVAYLDNMNNGKAKEVEIPESLLFLNENHPLSPIQTDNQQKEDKYFKTRNLLNKIETAVLKVKQQDLKMTGTNVGKAFPVPITAPAITDALYNHKSKINSLIKMYPGQWTTARSEFKPLKNIIKSDTEDSE
ncbi:MAG: hypothetical protein K9H49_01160 [Bacteroidales bacterium]|nr:hypothetical protein [Bacteroidales bacterium]MCF8403806.1 hypothetical protein [Bacteroidales bacterium]